MIKVSINGFGRIGRLFFRHAFGHKDLDFVAINDLGDCENLAYLLKYDTVYGRFPYEVKSKNEKGKSFLLVGNKQIPFFQEKEPEKLPWKDLGVDIAVESTGAFESFEKASVHLKAGARRVVLTAPAKDPDGDSGKTILSGVNESDFKTCKISSNGSCTTNAGSPVIQILQENFGVEKAILNTVHGYTATQNLVDGPTRGKDFRRGRAAAQNLVPSTTGAAIAVTRAIKELSGKFDGVSYRIPLVSGSLAVITAILKKNVSAEEINEVFKKEAKDKRWENILKVTEGQIVSSDIIGEPFGAIIDLPLTKVIDGNLVNVLSWYDNEMGYVATLLRHVLGAGRYL